MDDAENVICKYFRKRLLGGNWSCMAEGVVRMAAKSRASYRAAPSETLLICLEGMLIYFGPDGGAAAGYRRIRRPGIPRHGRLRKWDIDGFVAAAYCAMDLAKNVICKNFWKRLLGGNWSCMAEGVVRMAAKPRASYRAALPETLSASYRAFNICDPRVNLIYNWKFKATGGLARSGLVAAANAAGMDTSVWSVDTSKMPTSVGLTMATAMTQGRLY